MSETAWEWARLIIGGGLFGFLGIVVARRGDRKKDQATDINDRFEDTSALAKYMREQVEKEVERQLGPIKAELAQVTAESHEMNEAVRSREVRLWRWETGGRLGVIPQLSFPILERLGLNGLFDPPTTSPTVPEGPTA